MTLFFHHLLHSVSRLVCTSESYEMDLILDVNTQLYPVNAGERFTFALASTLDEDGVPDDGVYDQRIGKRSLADKYEYVMHGHVFRCEELKDNKL